jgi:hypothetical protein
MTFAVAAGADASAGTGVSPTMAALPPGQRQAANQSIGNELDQKLPAQLTALLSGTTLTADAVFKLSGALNSSLRSTLSKSFGVQGPTGSGGGKAPAGGPSLSLSVGTKQLTGKTPTGAISVKTGLKFSVGAQLKASLGVVIDSGLLGAGVPLSQRSKLKSELEPALSKSLDDSLGSAFGPDPGYPHASGVLLTSAEVTMQTQGPWFADVELDLPDDQDVPDGPFRFEIEGVEFVGAVKPERSGRFAGRTHLRVVGGAGGLEAQLSARNYAGGVTRHRTVVSDILRDSGETLSSESDAAILDTQITGWHRSECTGRQALDQICAKASCTWRVLRDGTVWVGNDGWPDTQPSGTVLDVHHGDGFVLSAPDVPDSVPGQVIEGHRVVQVVHRLDERGLRTEHHSRSVRSVRDKLLEPAMVEIDYSRRYPCKVVNQNADGSLQVVPEDAKIKGSGLDHCDVYVGLPGTRLKVPSGAECLVAFKAGDPSRAYIDGWLQGTPFTSIDIG